MVKQDRKRDPNWLWPALVALSAVAIAGAVLAPHLAWLVVPFVGAVGWTLQGHRAKTIATWVVPAGIVLAGLDLAAGASPGTPPMLRFGVLAGAGLTALMVVNRSTQLWWLSRLPNRWLAQPWLVRIELMYFSYEVRRGNAICDRINHEGRTTRGMRELAAARTRALRARDDAVVWRGAWDAYIATLETAEQALDASSPGSLAGAIEERHQMLIEAQRAAARDMRSIDPYGVSIS